jgi:exonuclease III
MWIAGNFKGLAMVFFSVYAPTNMYPLEEKLIFYEQLEGQFKEVPNIYSKHVLFGGDLNARIGSKVPGTYDRTRGDFIFGQSNFVYS